MSRCRIIAVMAILLIIAAKSAQATIGQVVAVIQESTVKGSEGSRTLEAGASVSVGDLLQSGPIGQAQLVFLDDTRLVVGPNSSLRIDTYLLRDPQSAKNLSISALRGTFRFLSGKSPKTAYSIQTSNATIGIRGTGFDISSRSNGSGVLVYIGTVVICNSLNECDSALSGDLVDVNAQGTLRTIDDPVEKIEYIRKYFPYVFDQTSLYAQFRIDTRLAFGSINEDTGSIEPAAASPG
jgi:hypothetical protein